MSVIKQDFYNNIIWIIYVLTFFVFVLKDNLKSSNIFWLNADFNRLKYIQIEGINKPKRTSDNFVKMITKTESSKHIAKSTTSQSRNVILIYFLFQVNSRWMVCWCPVQCAITNLSVRNRRLNTDDFIRRDTRPPIRRTSGAPTSSGQGN